MSNQFPEEESMWYKGGDVSTPEYWVINSEPKKNRVGIRNSWYDIPGRPKQNLITYIDIDTFMMNYVNSKEIPEIDYLRQDLKEVVGLTERKKATINELRNKRDEICLAVVAKNKYFGSELKQMVEKMNDYNYKIDSALGTLEALEEVVVRKSQKVKQVEGRVYSIIIHW